MPSTLIWRIITDAHEGAKARAPADASRRAVGRRFAGHWQDDYRGRRSDRDQPADAEHDCQWSRPGDARRGGVARQGARQWPWLVAGGQMAHDGTSMRHRWLFKGAVTT